MFDKEVFDHWEGKNMESEVIPHLVEKGLVYTYQHDGFFKSLDSYKDQREFEGIMKDGDLPWAVKE